MRVFRQFIYILLLIGIASSIFIVSCSSEDDPVVIDDSGSDQAPTTPDDPVVEPPTVTAPVSLSGIWAGTMTNTQTSIIYDVDMVFYMPEGETEGHLLAVVASQGTGEPHILVEAGYDMDPNDSWGYEYYAGTTSSQGTFVKYFEFANKLVGSNKGGSIGLDLSENTLTGDVQLDDGSKFDIVLEYSLQNAKDTTMVDLEGTWSDANNGWDDSSTGVDLTVDPAGAVSALVTGVNVSSCTGSGLAIDISNYNIFNFDFDLSASGITGVTLSNCDTRLVNEGLSTEVDAVVNGDYSGMAVLVEDDAGNSILKLILSSQKLTPAIATYNEFIKN
jgi:hypothetical protein